MWNIYPMNILLCKMKARGDQICSYCNEHFFFDSQQFGNVEIRYYIEKNILITFNIWIHLTFVNVSVQNKTE